jgi:ABC-2 type transport system permease protein
MNTYTLPRPKALLSKAPLAKALLPKTAPRAAFGKIILNEVRLAWRLPAGLIFGVAVPLVLLIIFGEIPSFHQPQPSLGGLVLFPVYVPIIICMAIAILGLISLPASLVSYRDQGILRRLSTTPVPASWVLAAQLVVEFCIAMTSLLIVIVVSIAAFGLAVPKNPGALLLAIVLSIAALFAIGLCIAAAARSGTAARAIGAGAFYPLLFFAGMWLPRQAMPGVLQGISNYTPLGASVEAIQDSMQGQFPPAASLLVLAGYALVFAFIARRYFRWE